MGTVNHRQSLNDRIAALEKEITAIRKRAGLGNSAISAGDLTLQSGGTLTVSLPDGQRVAKIGYLGGAGPDALYGAQFFRPDGSEAIIIYGSQSGSDSFVGFRDKAGNIIFSDDNDSGMGISTPWLPYPSPTPLTPTTWGATQAATFVTVARSRIKVTHPLISGYVTTYGAGATGTGQVLVNGIAIDTTFAVSNGVQSSHRFTDIPIPGWGTSVVFLQEITVELQLETANVSFPVYGTFEMLYGT